MKKRAVNLEMLTVLILKKMRNEWRLN
jgi:hypothetical protein